MSANGSKLSFRIREIARRMWVRVTAFSLGGILLAVLAWAVGPHLPHVPSIDLAAGAVDSILNIIAASMLAVTTFSVSIMVQAFGSATSNATPRATRLLADDASAQNAVAVFIGSFLFSIVGIIGLAAGFYPDQARVILFFATLGVIGLITVTLLRWFNHLNDFGRVRDIVRRLEAEAAPAADVIRSTPTLGANPAPSPLGPAHPVLASETSGYVRYLAMDQIGKAAAAAGLCVQVMRMPGKYVHEGEPLLRLSGPPDGATAKALRAAFDIGTSRSFDQDLGYGLVVLSEVASRALSPAVNDPGTAIEVLRAGTRVLMRLQTAQPAPAAGGGDTLADVHAPAPDLAAIYESFFWPIARDGAGLVEVQETLLDCLDALGRAGAGAPAARIAGRAMARSAPELQDWERARLRPGRDGVA